MLEAKPEKLDTETTAPDFGAELMNQLLGRDARVFVMGGPSGL